MTQPKLTQINIYPVKSVGGISMSTAWVEKQGLAFDRRFMLAFEDGGMVTARRFPQMVNIHSMLVADGVRFVAPNLDSLVIRYEQFTMEAFDTKVWSDTFSSYTTTFEADRWFSAIIGEPVRLVYTGEQSNRFREKLGQNVSFADGYPLLVISQASLDELNRRSSEQHSMDQFRSNLVVSNCEAFSEDRWKRIRIGDVEFEIVKPCERCILTTVDLETGDFRASKEPLKTLATFRANEHGAVFFGQNLVPVNEGMICADDPVEVIEYQDGDVYPDNSTEVTLRCIGKETIARDFVAFDFELPEGHEMAFIAGQYLTLKLPIDGEVVTRCYSFSSSPLNTQIVSIAVKRVDGGRASNWLIDQFNVGDTVLGLPPHGEFCLESNTSQPILLLSAGSGITPMMSMLRYLCQSQKFNSIVFYHQCRTVDDIPYQQELDQLKSEHANLRVRISLTQPPLDWFGLKGRLSLSHLKQIQDVESHQVYVCGPDGFMDKAKNLLMKKGLAATAYHQENFTLAPLISQAEQALTITLNDTAIYGNNQSTLLEQAERNGVAIANSCRAGLCGACRVKVVEGLVNQADAPALPHIDTENGMVLACCCVPLSDVKIEF